MLEASRAFLLPVEIDQQLHELTGAGVPAAEVVRQIMERFDQRPE